jgi:hypothetical protein
MPARHPPSEDRGFKALLTAYPAEAIEALVPELLAARGRPTRIVPLQQESQRPSLADPSRFLDIALLAQWRDGSEAVVVLVEHWSSARRVDMRRVLWYVADLALRHPQAAVCPIILLTDPAATAIDERWQMTVAGRSTVAMHTWVVRVAERDLPRLRALQNRVASALLALAMPGDRMRAVQAALVHMARAPGPEEDLERFLPFIMRLARMPAQEAPRLRRALEEDAVLNPITEIKKAAVARGRAEAASELVRCMLRLVQRGAVKQADAMAEVEDFITMGLLSRSAAAAAIADLKRAPGRRAAGTGKRAVGAGRPALRRRGRRG